MNGLPAETAGGAPADSGAANHVPAAGEPRYQSLRAKGLLLLAGFATYALCASALLLHQTAALLEQTQVVAKYGVVETALAATRADLALGASLAEGPVIASGAHAAGVLTGLGREVREYDAALAARLEQAAHEIQSAAGSGAERGTTQQVLARLAGEARQAAARQQARVQREGAAVTGVAVVVTILGLAGAAAIWGLFFTRLVRDLARLKKRAEAIVEGFRGAPLAVARRDEVGSLMGAVNRMAGDLESRERALHSRQAQGAHRERMALVGGVATGVLHEIGNPLTTIVAISRELAAGASIDAAHKPLLPMLEEQSQRIAATVARLRVLTDSRSREVQPVDINEVVRSACELVRFERRFSDVRFSLEFGSALPAASAIEDDLLQVVLAALGELIANPDDGALPARGIAVATAATASGIEIHLTGSGLHATRAAAQVEMWNRLLRRSAGSVELTAVDGHARVSVWLPVYPTL